MTPDRKDYLARLLFGLAVAWFWGGFLTIMPISYYFIIREGLTPHSANWLTLGAASGFGAWALCRLALLWMHGGKYNPL
jgi:hypothetical protein